MRGFPQGNLVICPWIWYPICSRCQDYFPPQSQPLYCVLNSPIKTLPRTIKYNLFMKATIYVFFICLYPFCIESTSMNALVFAQAFSQQTMLWTANWQLQMASFRERRKKCHFSCFLIMSHGWHWVRFLIDGPASDKLANIPLQERPQRLVVHHLLETRPFDFRTSLNSLHLHSG